MTAERDSMTLNEVSVPALGVDVATRPPGPAAPDDPGPGGCGQAEAAPVHRRVSLRILEEADRCTSARRGGPPASPRQLASDGLAQGAAQGLAALAAKKRGAKPAERNPLDAKVRALDGSPGARVAHRAHDPGRAGKSCRAAGIEPRTRALLIAVQPLAAQVGVAPACQALGVSRATTVAEVNSRAPAAPSARALCEAERSRSSMCSPARASSTVRRRRSWRRCSTKATCARSRCIILAADQPVRERRNQREHPQYIKPELPRRRTRPSWDITTKWTYFYLYVVLDIFSRYAVGWMVA